MEANVNGSAGVDLTQPVPHLLAGEMPRRRLKRKKKRIVVDRQRKCPCPYLECENVRKECERLKAEGTRIMQECIECDQKAADMKNSSQRKYADDVGIDGG